MEKKICGAPQRQLYLVPCFEKSLFSKTSRFIVTGLLIFLSLSSYGLDLLKRDTTKRDTVQKDTSKRDTTTVFSFLNAADFDVNGIGKSNYLGHINIYSPSIRGGKLGFNAGIMKISYNSDSSIIYQRENILTNPIKDLKVGDSYNRQLNKYDKIVTNTAYSLYIQPTFTLYSDDDFNRVMFHLHNELLIFNTKVSSSYTTMAQDSLVFTAADSASSNFVARGNVTESNPPTYKTSNLNGYFGAGFTFDLKFGKSGSFFFQPTFGWTTNFPNFQSNLGRRGRDQDKWNTFYLVRAYFTEKLSNNSKIVLGTDIRGLFPRYSPLYSIYAGLSLNIEAVASLFK
ncbi:hypothetical protein IM792_11485 [Mucilaginibacter sp. JRF]|uniref:hypothetical protein n=1 Tax=Mucilaginibacter sp. JRF TaxID=2780088 RepID=UPI001882533D|nr:hypothetical protein [Mucilaginibacter sp. JRF]MBE9585073.1 hypothetical protein [Mucilaginibacter sp. JRF]